MALVAESRRINDQRPEPRRLDFELAFRAMSRATGEGGGNGVRACRGDAPHLHDATTSWTANLTANPGL
jgi:hypothetical protein